MIKSEQNIYFTILFIIIIIKYPLACVKSARYYGFIYKSLYLKNSG